MGMGHVNTANTYLRDVKKSAEPLLMTTFPVASMVTTYSFNSPITDSAAAGTALSTGLKTVNSRIGMTPDSLYCRSIASRLMEGGYAVGVATSVAGDDATPAAFYAHALGRNETDRIAPQATHSGLAFLGAGNFKINDGKRADAAKRWLAEMQEEGGYTLVNSLSDLRGKMRARKVLLMPEFSSYGQIGYTVDSIPEAISLAEITTAAIETLRKANPEKFFLMVEGGNIDWAAHANDGAAVIKEIINFQDAIGEAYRFYMEHPDETLIVVTADHDTGGMALGREDNRKNPDLSLIDFQRISKDRFNHLLEEDIKENRPITWEGMEAVLRDKFSLWDNLVLTEAENEQLRQSFADTFETGEAKDTETWYQNFKGFTMTLYDLLNRHYGIGWTTTSHTGNMVPVYAIGVGAERFAPQLDNTDLPRLIN